MDQSQKPNLPALAPTWMLQSSTFPKKRRRLPKTHNTNHEVLADLSERCSAFLEDFETQKQESLSEPEWFNWISMLVNAGFPEAASKFSKMSYKHNQRSEKRISEMKLKPINALTKCTTFGCDEEQIKSCFNNKITRDKSEEIINSPGRLIALGAHTEPEIDLTDLGFTLDKKTGTPIKLNSNIFTKYVVDSKLDIIFVNPNLFYLYDNGLGLWSLLNSNELQRKMRDILHEYAPNFWTPKIQDNYLHALELEAPSVDKMDADRNHINLVNGMLNLDNYQLVPHDKKYHSTIRIPIDFDPVARCPTFMKFLKDIFENDDDLIKLVQEIFGYCLTSDISAQKAFILYGKGANGKSVLSDILSTLVGSSNTCSLTLSDLDKSFARAELVNKQLLLSTENETDSKGINTQFFKAITSGDTIRVERKHEQGFTYRPFCKIVLGMNNLPYSRDKSHGYFRRLIIIPFNRTFEKEEADVRLTEKLKTELPGILNFSLEGLNRLRSNGLVFTNPVIVQNVLSMYEEEQNPITTFVDDMIEKGSPQDRISNASLLIAYKNWCRSSNHNYNFSNNQRFITALRATLLGKGIKSAPEKSAGNRFCNGIRFISIAKPPRPTFLNRVNEYTEVSIDEM
ncbi:DNA primase family protein [Paenibacillus sp. 2KB_22]|uniref:DNA primase family protein n=1 Tax=Paenibacillus sp. 2KB_22 TaxID=3232978 RepID=UPI003F946172